MNNNKKTADVDLDLRFAYSVILIEAGYTGTHCTYQCDNMVVVLFFISGLSEISVPIGRGL